MNGRRRLLPLEAKVAASSAQKDLTSKEVRGIIIEAGSTRMECPSKEFGIGADGQE